MKKKTLGSFLLYLFFSFLALPIQSQINSDFKDKFTFGAFNYFPFHPDFHNSSGNDQLNWYKQLSFNFLEGHNGDGSYPNDMWGSSNIPLSIYWSNVNNMLSSWHTNFGNYSTILIEDKVAKPCYGQLSIYQAEHAGTWHSVSPGYGYDTVGVGTDTTETWNGESFKCVRVKTGRNDSGYVLRKLYENKEQVNWNWMGSYMNDINTYWFIKPKMRIDTTFGMPHDTIPVVAIIIKDFWGVTQDSIIIKVENFKESGHYDGSFRETYVYPNSPYRLSIHGSQLVDSTVTEENMDLSKVDYQVYWFKKCDISIDYVKVDNEIANFLFNPAVDPNTYEFSYVKKIYNATDSLTTGKYNSGKRYSYFYLDEFEYNMIPSIAEVNRLIKDSNSNSGVICLFSQNRSDWWLKTSLRNIPLYHEAMEYLKSSGAIQDIFFSEPYPFEDKIPLPPNVPKLPDTITYPRTNHYYKAASNNIYNDSMNNFMERNHMRNFRDVSSAVKNTDIIFSLCTQVHSFEEYWQADSTQAKYYVLREPLSEEIKMQNYLGLAYGAKQLIFFINQSFHNYWTNTPADTIPHTFGMLEYPVIGGQRRFTNYYGLPKWNAVARDDSTILRMGKYLIDEKKLKWDAARTVKFNPLPYKYTDSIKSYFRNSSHGWTFSPTYEDENKYWELGYFDANSTVEPVNYNYTKYFLAVNRRCAPEDTNGTGDIRNLKIKFNSSGLIAFANWKLINTMTNEVLATFDKNNSGYVDAGVFQPGEGKLFKLVPVMIDGGTFVTSEYLYNISFNCNGVVNTNGHNLTIAEGVNISFAENAQIRMKKGEFLSGIDLESDGVGIEQSYLKAQNGSTWNGIYFDSTDVDMGYLTIKDVKKDAATNSGYVLNFINCDTVMVERTYITTTDSAGCINIYYSSGGVTNPLIDINNDSLLTKAPVNPPLKIYSNSSLSGSFAISDNVIRNMAFNGGTGINIYGLQDVLIKANILTYFNRGIFSNHSSPDLWANNIASGTAPGFSFAVCGEGTTVFDMSSVAGGYNTYNIDSGGCVTLDNSYFDMHNGNNWFRRNDTLNHYFFQGYFQSAYTSTLEDGRTNCFFYNSWTPLDSAHVRYNIILGIGTRVYYRLNCSGAMDNTKTVVKNDSEIKKSLSKNIENKTPNDSRTLLHTDKSFSGDDIENKVLLSRELYAEMKSALKENNYSKAAGKCRAILELGIEGMYSVDAVRKLFHCTAMLKDKNSLRRIISNSVTSQSKVRNGKITKQRDAGNEKSKTVQRSFTSNSMSDLKSYYESYIQSHPGNNAIINEMFYFIQKCKINLGDYESALNGYRAIMEKNHSSMAGLSAKWEYSDLQLFVSSKTNGTGGAENQLTFNNEQQTDEQKHARLMQLVEDMQEGPKDGPRDGKDKYDKKKFTAEDRKVITNNIVNTLESNDKNDKTRLKSLEEKVINNQADATETSEYKKRLLLKELIKIQRVNNINEQIAMIDTDLRKIFSLDQPAGNEQQSRTSTEVAFDYKLNQNYPNPFNPTTKINFELKTTGFVSLKIYDLLGREIAELVNETKDAGRYTIDFNASKYMMASGIYFYRIKAGEFVQTKRMVLVK